MAVLLLPTANSSSGGQVHLSDPQERLERGEGRRCTVSHGYSEDTGCFVLTCVFLAHCFPGCLTTSASADLTDTTGVELVEPLSPTLPCASRSRVSGTFCHSASALSKMST